MSNVGAPLVSVLMPSYNHAPFIRSAVESVLAQTLTELELIIVDDGSRDSSANIISTMSDQRVRFQLLRQNAGACHAMNLALQMSSGKLIAVCNSDDEWHPEKLRRQLRLMERLPNIAVLFSDVRWIADDGAQLSPFALPVASTIFRQQNRSRWSWLRSLLEGGNCLCHPSILARREVYDVTGVYDNQLRQLPDFDMWIRILERFDIFVMRDKLVSFRLHGGNTSTPSPEASRRDMNEYRIILRRLMKRISSDNFARTFGFRNLTIDDELDLEIEKAFYLLSYYGKYAGIFRELACDILSETFDSLSGRQRLSDKFLFEDKDFQSVMGAYTPWMTVPDPLRGA
jgi:glycosyltransferase involved in cell wall biosynthesis